MNQPIARHPDPSTLMAYAAGTLGEALSAVVAAHLERCPACRSDVRLMTDVAGALFASLDGEKSGQPPPVSPAPGEAPAPAVAPSQDALPAILRRRYSLSFATVPWKTMGPGLWFHWLPLTRPASGELRLIKVDPGRRIPAHAHDGSELTYVIEGGFSDVTGSYGPGDVQDVDSDVEHTPIADPEGCICLVAAEAPAKFKGLAGRLVQPFTRR